MISPRYILHADMDAFYASIEQRDNPALRGKPVIVGATSPRGVVAAASYEARKYGVYSAMPGFEARRLCPQAICVAGRHSHYASVSVQIQEIFHSFTPLVEPLALDEAFLNVTGCIHLFGDVERLARQLQQKVWEVTALRVSVGVAPNKLVAKIACAQGKPRGLVLVNAQGVTDFLSPLAIGKLWGVGPVMEKRLRAIGVSTLGELSAFDSGVLRRLLGPRALEMQQLARGEDAREVVVNRLPKSYGEENTFEVDITSSQRVFEVLALHADSVASRLRQARVRGRTITLKVRPARAAKRPYSGARGAHHTTLTRSRSLAQPVDNAETIVDVARALWEALGTDEPIRLLGLSVSGLQKTSEAGGQQLDLFAVETGRTKANYSAQRARSEPRVPIGPTLDLIEKRFGAGSIRRAVRALPRSIVPGQPPPGDPEE